MARLIEIHDVANCPGILTVQAGDVLLLSAAGARLHADDGVVEPLGSFLVGTLADHGGIVSPMGPPARVLLIARRPGQASVDIIVGDPFYAPRTIRLKVVVEA